LLAAAVRQTTSGAGRRGAAPARPAVQADFFRAWLRHGHDSSEQAEAALETYWPHYARNGGAAFARQIEALDVRDTLAVADRRPDLNLPARVVWGTADRFQSIEVGERLARDLNAPLRRIEGARHFTPEDHPEVVAEEINLLLEGSAQRPPTDESTPIACYPARLEASTMTRKSAEVCARSQNRGPVQLE
jgi:pimeloyl-ACP methyl ester carboxylesterase